MNREYSTKWKRKEKTPGDGKENEKNVLESSDFALVIKLVVEGTLDVWIHNAGIELGETGGNRKRAKLLYS